MANKPLRHQFMNEGAVHVLDVLRQHGHHEWTAGAATSFLVENGYAVIGPVAAGLRHEYHESVTDLIYLTWRGTALTMYLWDDPVAALTFAREQRHRERHETRLKMETTIKDYGLDAIFGYCYERSVDEPSYKFQIIPEPDMEEDFPFAEPHTVHYLLQKDSITIATWSEHSFFRYAVIGARYGKNHQ